MRSIVWLFLALGLLTSSYAYTVSGILNQGESIPVGNLKFYLEDLERDSHNAIVYTRDANDNILSIDEIPQGSSVTKTIAGNDYIIFVNKTAEGYMLISKWALMGVTTGAQLLNIGDTTSFDGSMLITLDDVGAPDRTALITIWDGQIEVSKERIAEGRYVVRNVGGQKYKITAVQTSEGYTMTSQWARIKVEPTTLAESPNNPVISVGEVLINGMLRVRLDDIERDTRSAIISVLDSSDNIISQDKIPIGGYIIRAAEGGQKYKIQLADSGPGYTLQAKWAKLTTQTSTFTETAKYTATNVGETLISGPVQVSLDDIEKDTRKAIVTINDGSGGYYHEKIAEGGYVIRTVGGSRYKIQAQQTAIGYMLIGKWAKITVQSTTSAPTTSYAGSSVISVGEAIITPADVKVRLDDIERDTRNAIISIIDSSDNVVFQEEIVPSSSGYIIRTVDGTKYQIKVYETAPGTMLISKWARMSVSTTTLTQTPPVGSIINVGEWMACSSGAKVRLDDIERDSRDAIITLLDSNDNTITVDRIPVGQTRTINPAGPACTVKIVNTAPGNLFIAKWARVQLS